MVRFGAIASNRLGLVRPIALIRVPRFPILANAFGLGDCRTASIWPDGERTRLILHDLHAQAHGDVEGDMAVDQPRPRVVGFERDDHVAVHGQQDHVAAGRVDEFEVHVVGIPLLVLGLLENCKVVAV